MSNYTLEIIWSTIVLGDRDHHLLTVMELVYENGEVLANETFDRIRARAKGDSV